MVNMPAKRGVRRGPSASTQISTLRKEIMGHKRMPSMDPSTFVQLPWNNWTFERTIGAADAAVDLEYKVNDVINQIAVRVGLTSVENCRIKVQSCSAWITAEGVPAVPDLTAEFFELSGQQIGQIQYPRSLQRDKGTLNKPAKAGFMYPLADRKEIFGSPEGLLKLATFSKAANCSLTVRISVLWQSGAAQTWLSDLE